MRPEDIPGAHPRLADKIAREFPDLRGQFDEARRMNIDELRQFQKVNNWKNGAGFPQQPPQRGQQQWPSMSGDPQWPDGRRGGGPQRGPQGGMPQWPGRHEADDLENRLKEKQKLLEEMDRKRKEDFKRYEMRMEHQQRAKLKEAQDEKERLKLEQELKDHREQILKHQRINHPAGRKQLEEVWDKQDGLTQEKFDPKTFFFLHDTNGDRYLDPLEMEALFYSEIKKVYGDDADGIEAHEDMARMREHSLNEMDEDRDGLVSLEEFMKYTSNKVFDTNDEWKPVRDHPEEVFTEQELEQFEKHYADYEADYDGIVSTNGDEPKGEEEHKGEGLKEKADHKDEVKELKAEKVEDHKVEVKAEEKKDENMVVPNEHAPAVGNAA
eukprot:Em0016g1045a